MDKYKIIKIINTLFRAVEESNWNKKYTIEKLLEMWRKIFGVTNEELEKAKKMTIQQIIDQLKQLDNDEKIPNNRTGNRRNNQDNKGAKSTHSRNGSKSKGKKSPVKNKGKKKI
jgi:hypothetical protein